MKTKNKILTVALLLAGAAAGTYAINKLIKTSATSAGLLRDSDALSYDWRLGRINYTKSGEGAPVVLLHDLFYGSSNYEWKKLIPELTDASRGSETYTVYAPDLLGCGTSEKPEMTYTNYMYVQLLCDFIRSEIGKRTSIIATGDSVPIVIMACRSNPELFDKLIFISPPTIASGSQIPSRLAKMYKFIVNLPILGTLLYNMASSKDSLSGVLSTRDFYDPGAAPGDISTAYYEAAHLGQYPKSLYASSICNYTKANYKSALGMLDHSITVISGHAAAHASQTAQEYIEVNPSIEVVMLDNCRRLPQLETPVEIANQLTVFLASK